MLRCPVCSTAALKVRRNRQPRYRCDRGHEFAAPREDPAEVTAFEAHYERSFIAAADAVPVSELKAAALRPSDQLSIEEVDIRRLEAALIRADPGIGDLLAQFFQLGTPDEPDPGDERAALPSDAGEGKSYTVSLADSREAVLRSIRQRRGQAAFRAALLRRFGGRCVITGCALADVLEAAHIWPYRGTRDNHPENGLLLRADIHTLYDLDLIAVDPERLCIAVAPVLSEVEPYGALSGQELRAEPHNRPSADALLHRWRAFEIKWLASG